MSKSLFSCNQEKVVHFRWMGWIKMTERFVLSRCLHLNLDWSHYWNWETYSKSRNEFDKHRRQIGTFWRIGPLRTMLQRLVNLWSCLKQMESSMISFIRRRRKLPSSLSWPFRKFVWNLIVHHWRIVWSKLPLRHCNHRHWPSTCLWKVKGHLNLAYCWIRQSHQ